MINLEKQIEDLFDKYNIQIQASTGQEFTIYCPFHKNLHTPSFYINYKTGLWQCFNPSCGKKGNFRQLYRQITGKALATNSRIDAVSLKNELERSLSYKDKDDDIVLDTIQIDYDDDEQKSYLMPLHERGLSYDTLMRFEIGFSKTKNRIVIPVRNQQYKVVGLIGRAIESSQEPRYLYNKGFKRADVLFNIQNAKNYSEVIVVEGSVDAMKVHEAGFPNVVATLGAQVSKNQITLIKKYFDKVIIFSDNDDAGNAMRDAIIDLCRGKEIYTAKISDGLKDPAEMQVQDIIDSINNKTHNI